MESIPYLIAPLFSGAVTLAAPPPSDIRFHRFMYAVAISCTSIIIAAIFRMQSNLQEIGSNLHLSAVVGAQLIIALFVIMGMHIYLSSSENRVKCAKVIAEQEKVERRINENLDQSNPTDILSNLKAAQKELIVANRIITGLVAIIYSMLVTALFPTILVFVKNLF